jgi:hypothetical protein
MTVRITSRFHCLTWSDLRAVWALNKNSTTCLCCRACSVDFKIYLFASIVFVDLKVQKWQAALLLLPESIRVVLFRMTGWGVVALYLVFAYACMNVCTELMMLQRWCTIGSCLAHVLLIFVAVVFATALTCYLSYLHIKNLEPYWKQYDLINLILNYFINLFMLSYDKNCDFLSWGKWYLHICGCVWHKWWAYLQLHHIIASYCIAHHSWMSLLAGHDRTVTALYVAWGGVRCSFIAYWVDMVYAFLLHPWWLIYWSIGYLLGCAWRFIFYGWGLFIYFIWGWMS